MGYFFNIKFRWGVPTCMCTTRPITQYPHQKNILTRFMSDNLAYIKVFRFQWKTFLLLYWLRLLRSSTFNGRLIVFFPIIKVFHFQRKTLILLFYCFFFSIIKVFRFHASKTITFFW